MTSGAGPQPDLSYVARLPTRTLDSVEHVRAEAHRRLAGLTTHTARDTEARPVRDPRPAFRALGSDGYLAPHWPISYGGLGMGLPEMAVVAEELVAHGVPDLLHTLTIQAVGSTLLECASPEMREEILPKFARGAATACVLFSEEGSGSDLSGLKTAAVPDPKGGWRLHGSKIYSMFASLADYGLVLARMPDGALSLFLIRMDRPGISLEVLPSIQEDAFHRTTLDGVAVSRGDVVGDVGAGWSLLVRTLAYERTGVDYLVKAEHWYGALVERWDAGGVGALDDRDDEVTVARLRARLDVGAATVRRVLARLEEKVLTEDEAASAKWYTSELASGVALAAIDMGLVGAGLESRVLQAAVSEAPGTRISGGTSEMMLETVARLRLDNGRRVMT